MESKNSVTVTECKDYKQNVSLVIKQLILFIALVEYKDKNIVNSKRIG